MKIHEYQAKQILRAAGMPCPDGFLVQSDADIARLAAQLSPGVWVVKAQVHAGGRGKGKVFRDDVEMGRGVRVTKSPDEAAAAARDILGARLVTIQTGERGRVVRRVLVEKGVDIAAEFYLAVILDRETSRIALMASTEGGTEIEVVARERPEKIHTVFVDPLTGFKEFHGRELGLRLGLPMDKVKAFSKFVAGLHAVFVSKDCSLAEINPLVLTRGGEFVALDAKLGFDDNGLFRHPELEELRDLSEEEPSEVEAEEARLTYIKLDGNIGCLVNGAGLAMATMDIIKEFGGEPANFLDVGGAATAQNVAKSFAIMLRDKVRGIFVNVFGGIVRCDVVAEGLVEALSKVRLDIPLVVRLAGNRRDEAAAILAASGLPIVTATDMEDGARKIVSACAKGA